MKTAALRASLIAHALALPGAYEDRPWGETVVKVGKKIFVFFGRDAEVRSISVKLPESRDAALAFPGAAPTGYGLGRAGWVSIPLGPDTPPREVLADLIDESFEAVAPKRVVAAMRSARGR